MKFFKCNSCGKVISILTEGVKDTNCCGKDMVELTPNSIEGKENTHLPVFDIEENKVLVNVGKENHPMRVDHLIEWIVIETNHGMQKKCLKADQAPRMEFALSKGEEIIAVYAYCNLHGLWKAEVKSEQLS